MSDYKPRYVEGTTIRYYDELDPDRTISMLLPACGESSRIHGLPKYLLPCPDGFLAKRHYDLMKQEGGIGGTIAKEENAELIKRYGVNGAFAYKHSTMTEALLDVYVNQILESASDFYSVLFGMPDTYIEDGQVYAKLKKALMKCDVAVAVFRARPGQHTHGGMVSFSHNRVTEVIDKPAETNLQYIWGALAWKPAFWDCLAPDMPHVGYGLPVAIERGLDVRAVICEGGFWDCGTPDEYFEMIRTLTGERVGA